ncbi:MAG: NUDIX hydrolase [Alphaproteobacteria bacterium]|nr:NUDIX hydrolase [Alphaproteobacteria bacterium]MDP6566161.1 NUDIX hydrolase [Alphaproteobacteria bacterium]MDP6813598.1 NUDIX hydrolase [Alphaproteobacteria bacterium]
MPDQYVFPGGRVDRADGYAHAAGELRPHVAERLGSAASAHRSRALAMAAVRETFEETGLVLGRPLAATPKRAAPAWREFFDTGFAPALDLLEYVHRAITPPFRPIRFNARFFLAEGDHLHGELRGSGELLDLEWIPVSKARELPTPAIQQIVLEDLPKLIDRNGKIRRLRKVPVRRTLHGAHVQEFE